MSSGDVCNYTRTEWAQRTGMLFITFCVEDCKDAEVKFEANKIIFHGEGGTPRQKHTAELELFKEIDPENSEWSQTQRSVSCRVQKKVDEPYWPRLLSTKVKQHWLKIDFNKYRDEDDSEPEDANEMEAEQPDLSQMMAGMARGAGTTLDDLGDEEEEDSDDSDDEELPGLETAPAEGDGASEPSTKPVANGGQEEAPEPQACDA